MFFALLAHIVRSRLTVHFSIVTESFAFRLRFCCVLKTLSLLLLLSLVLGLTKNIFFFLFDTVTY